MMALPASYGLYAPGAIPNAHMILLSHLESTLGDDTGNNSLSLYTGTLDTGTKKWGTASLKGTASGGGCKVDGNLTSFNWSGPWTIEAWFLINSVINQARIFCATDSSFSKPVLLYMDSSGHIVLTNGSSGITSTATWNDGNWHIVQAVYDGSGGGFGHTNLYIDGSAANAQNNGAIYGSHVATPYITIGARSVNGTTAAQWWDGWIDEVRIDDIARSASVPTGPYTIFSP